MVPANDTVTAHQTRDPRNGWLAQIMVERRRAREVAESGCEARWYVRGAMDPAYATEEARDRMVAWLVHLGPQAPNRHHYAAEFLRGWAEHRPKVEGCRRVCAHAVAVGVGGVSVPCGWYPDACHHYGEPQTVLPAHRLFGRTQVVVTRV